ncbi:hypothetical protein Kpol_1064p27 [Vanderwaltozyma polyspora DSM 70294]|uniref:Uncharacterized protein n=1 Tax=Vanderwaltozyma polyspora (strain ATCC 22028 / DSM 70294 / BCRC 21397 / CBS 2163 / NBRC 10782 / NRRL Y-8283 / UCD 57-17) TaxID=436907 RepID=A7TMF2_VANPO|nr:uncharacterized protein Kpol_1064p27 [Vanderwaltozyma polyspora DSM 70294]EDO16546.1 hypothetical protein Kpol_1064p27 [Vanderwaltozyma polyspora DSM 70294]
MPRKFLGERISSETDALRPASLTVTSADLLRLPSLPDDLSHTDDGNTFIEPIKGKRKLSSKFGGTIKLKQRLSSVPELFLRESKRKRNMQRTKGSGRIPTFRKHSKRVSMIEEETKSMTSKDDHSLHNGKPIQAQDKNEDSKVYDLVFVSKPLVMPVQLPPLPMQLVQPPNPVYKNMEAVESHSDVILDEIIAAYIDGNNKESAEELKKGIDYVLNQMSDKSQLKRSKNVNVNHPKIVGEMFGSALMETPSLEPTVTNDHLDNVLSSPEYTATSSGDQWSTGDEFSDINSIGQSICFEEPMAKTPCSEDTDFYSDLEDEAITPVIEQKHTFRNISNKSGIDLEVITSDMRNITLNADEISAKNTISTVQLFKCEIPPPRILCNDVYDSE